MKRILISAYTVSPVRGSEPGMAWKWIIELSKYYEIILVTSGEYLEELKLGLLSHSAANIEVVYVSMPKLGQRLGKTQGKWLFYVFYKYWQFKVYNRVKIILKTENFSLLHQLNMTGFREPGFLHRFSVPSVWGPIGGMNTYPLIMERRLTWDWFKIFIKNWLIRLQLRYDPFVRIAFTGFSEVVISNQSAADTLIGYYDLKPSIINENGLSSFSVINRVLQATVIRVLWVGKDLWTKRLDIALTIMNSIDTKGVEVEFHVVGIDSNVAASLNSNVTFVNHGILGRNELELLFKSCHINLFTSLSEGTPAVVLEGIHHGLWTICFDVCGQGDIIKSSFGDKIVPTAYETSFTKL